MRKTTLHNYYPLLQLSFLKQIDVTGTRYIPTDVLRKVNEINTQTDSPDGSETVDMSDLTEETTSLFSRLRISSTSSR